MSSEKGLFGVLEQKIKVTRQLAKESIHFQKIRLSDVVVLINKGAVGQHTALELDYCQKIGKQVVVFGTIEQTDAQIKEVLGVSPTKQNKEETT